MALEAYWRLFYYFTGKEIVCFMSGIYQGNPAGKREITLDLGLNNKPYHWEHSTAIANWASPVCIVCDCFILRIVGYYLPNTPGFIN